MKLGEYDFDFVCDIVPACDGEGVLAQFMPQSRYCNTRNLPLSKYGAGPFCKFKIPTRLTQCGVYALTVGADLRYIGECTNLSKRFNVGYGNISPKNCFKGGQETNCRLNGLVHAAILGGEQLSLWFLQTANYKAIELALRRLLKPLWNRV